MIFVQKHDENKPPGKGKRIREDNIKRDKKT